MWGSIIGAGASLLGGLFGGDDEPKETRNYVDYQRMVKDAEAAGFNPLTALRNGGAAGFSVSSTTGTPLSSRLANGIAGAANTFLNNFDPFADQSREAQFNLIEAQVANLQADTSLKRVQLGGVPSYTAGTQYKKVGTGVKHGQTFKSAADVLPASAGQSRTPEVETPTVTNPYPTSWGIEVNSNLPDASAYEERYGDSEIAQMIYGAGNFIGDLNHNFGRADRYLKNKIERPIAAEFNSLRKQWRDGAAKAKPPKGYSTTTDVIYDIWNNGLSFDRKPRLSRKKY